MPVGPVGGVAAEATHGSRSARLGMIPCPTCIVVGGGVPPLSSLLCRAQRLPQDKAGYSSGGGGWGDTAPSPAPDAAFATAAAATAVT